MVNGSLTDYIRAQLQRGYTPEAVRSVLLQSGYNPQDIDFALRIATRPVSQTFSLTGRAMVFVLGGIFVIILLVFAALFLFTSTPKDIQIQLRVQPEQVLPGGTIAVSAVLTSAQSSETPVDIAYMVSEQYTHASVTSRNEKLKVGASAVSSEQIPIPASLSPGAYEVRITAQFDGTTRTQTASFDVLQPATAPSTPATPVPVEEQPEVVQCPPSCDDLNPATDDTCVRGSCVHALKPDFCGNGQCESTENSVQCAADCGGTQDKSAVQDQAVKVAKSDPEKAATLCNSLTIPVDVDPCFAAIANASKKSALCASITDSGIRDNCLMEFAFTGDYTVCNQLSNRYLLTSCQSLARFSTVQQEQSAAEQEAQQITNERNATEA